MNATSLKLATITGLLLAAPAFAMQTGLTIAFPGAQGFGALATGGRGGEVVHVTNLSDDGPGSLRQAVSQEKRIVVFDVGGVIEIKKPLIVASNISIFGQSAPAPGITVYGDSVSFSDKQNIIVRHIRLRQGIESGRGAKTLNVSNGQNMIFDHISAGWGRWDTLGITQKSARITLQDCLFAEAIDPQRFGGLVDSSTDITICRNLWMNNQSRSPKIKAHLQYINNVVYNWGASGVPGGHSAAVWNQDVINNLFLKGPSSTDNFFEMFASTDHVYQTGNIADLTPDGALNGRPVVEADFHGKTPPTFQPAPFNVPPVPVPILSVPAAYQAALTSAGASLWRDEVDQRLIAQLASLGTQGAIIHSEAEVGGQPPVGLTHHPAGYDADADGIEDAWERAHNLNPQNRADAAQDADGNGYTNIEEFLHALAVPMPQ